MVHSKSDTFRRAWATVETKTLQTATDQSETTKTLKTATDPSEKCEKRVQEETDDGHQRKKAKATKTTKAASVDDILLQKAMRLKQKWLTVCGQATAFVGAVQTDAQFSWISAANMEPIKIAQGQLDKDRCINKAVCVDTIAFSCVAAERMHKAIVGVIEAPFVVDLCFLVDMQWPVNVLALHMC
jgi:hypothetical protein